MPYIYVAKDGNGLYKIGRSGYPPRRIKESLTEQQYGQLTLVAAYECTWGDISNIERAVHLLFCRQRRLMELFSLSDLDLMMLDSLASMEYFGFKKIKLEDIKDHKYWNNITVSNGGSTTTYSHTDDY